MKTYIQDGDTMPLTAPYDVVAGGGMLIGSLFAVAIAAAASGAAVQGRTRGVIDIPKATGEAWTLGAKVYWDNTAKKLTTTSSGNTLVGVAAQAQASGDTVGRAKLGIVA
jgi:predicted RecA/RadA family phage recombinase